MQPRTRYPDRTVLSLSAQIGIRECGFRLRKIPEAVRFAAGWLRLQRRYSMRGRLLPLSAQIRIRERDRARSLKPSASRPGGYVFRGAIRCEGGYCPCRRRFESASAIAQDL